MINICNVIIKLEAGEEGPVKIEKKKVTGTFWTRLEPGGKFSISWCERSK